MIKLDTLPVYVHCLDGADVTGVVIACLRRLQVTSFPVDAQNVLSNCVAGQYYQTSGRPPTHPHRTPLSTANIEHTCKARVEMHVCMPARTHAHTQGWHSECISNEVCRYARNSEMVSAELKFVNSMKEIEIADPCSLPDWLWQVSCLSACSSSRICQLTPASGVWQKCWHRGGSVD